MKIVWKVVTGILLAMAILCIARVAMYGPESLPFVGALSGAPKSGATGSGQTSAVSAQTPTVSSPSGINTQPQRTAPPPAISRPSGGSSQPSSMPNPPTIYDRARRAGNRPNQGTEE